MFILGDAEAESRAFRTSFAVFQSAVMPLNSGARDFCKGFHIRGFKSLFLVICTFGWRTQSVRIVAF